MSDAFDSGSGTESDGEFDPRPTFLLDHSDVNGTPREDLWRQGIQDLDNLSFAPGYVWTPIGPGPLTNSGSRTYNGPGPLSGEVTDIAIDPGGTSDQIIYIATNDGGIWKTEDGGLRWRPLTDHLPSLSMGAVALDPANSSVVYAGSGNPFDGGHEFGRGAGLYKSTDGGLTWSILDGGPFSTTLAGLHINRILVLPGNVLLVATKAGLFRSEDGGLNFGANTPQFNDGHPLPDIGEAEITSLALDTHDPSKVYAAASGRGIFVSTDTGRTFPAASNLLGAGHTGAPVTYSDMAFAQSTQPDGNTLYASVQYDPPNGSRQYIGLFISTNAGATWTPRPDAKAKADSDGAAQTNYDLTIGVDPQNAQRVYVGFQQLWVSNDGGQTFGADPITRNASHVDQVHWDHHALKFQPPSHWPAPPAPAQPTRLYVGTDGGIARMDVATSGAISWANLNGATSDGIATNLIYSLDMGRGSAANNQFMYGGAQDLGLEARDSTDVGTRWRLSLSGDGTLVAVDPSDPQIVYAFSNESFAKFNHGTWVRGADAGSTIGLGLPNPATDWTRQLALEQNNANSATRVVFASVITQLFKSIDAGAHFTSLWTFGSRVFALATTRLDSNRVWVGLGDGTVHMSADGGMSWDQGNFQPQTGALGSLTGIAIDPASINRVVIVCAGFSNINSKYRTKRVFMTEDNGATWRDISGTDGQPDSNLPDLPLHSVVMDGSTTPSTIIVASDAAVLCSKDLGATWQILGWGLPNVLCRSLALDPSAAPRLLRAGTYGRSCFELTHVSGQQLAVKRNLAFDAVRVGTHVGLPVQILNVGTSDLQITGFSRIAGSTDFSIVPAPALPLTLHAGEKRTFNIQFQPSSASELGAGFQIISDDPANITTLFTASGRGITGPGTARLAVRTNLGFGLVTKDGGARTLTADLVNTGTADLHITGITRTDGDSAFDLAPAPTLPATITPGDKLALTFRFDPGSNGDDVRATFQIATDDPRSPASVELRGNATGFASTWLIVLLVVLGAAAAAGGAYLIYEEATK